MSNLVELRRQAIFSHSRGKLEQAASGYAAILSDNPSDVEILYLSGMLEGQREQFERSAELLTQAVALNPDHFEGHLYLAMALRSAGQTEKSLLELDAALNLSASSPEALIAKAEVLQELNRFAEAISTLDQILSAQPKHSAAWLRRGMAFQASGDLQGALQSFEKARQSNPTIAEHHLREGHVLLALNRNNEARGAFDRAVQIDDALFAGHLGRATAMLRLHNVVAASLSADKARQLQPEAARPYFILGVGQAELGHLEQALVQFDEALSRDATNAETWFAKGEVFQKLNRHADAGEAYSRARELQPELPMVVGNLLQAQLEDCDWSNFPSLSAEISEKIGANLPVSSPVALHGFCDDEATLRRCAEITSKSFFPQVGDGIARPRNRAGGASANDKLRIGYLSGEVRDSISGGVLLSLLTHHDRDRFEITLIDTGLADQSEIRTKLESATDRLLVVTDMSDNEAANRIAALQLDALIDLNGFFSFARPGILAIRPCNVQVNYGLSGTLGAEFMDYLFADSRLIPESHQKYYREKIIYLDEGAQLTYPWSLVGADKPSRSQCGLPEDAVVLACLQPGARITPALFAAWMEILQAVPDSVLWLLEQSEAMKANLLGAATSAGVASEKLFFAQPAPPTEHFARHRVADLFLDTLPWSSAEPILVGMPVLTVQGGSMHGRVASSLLQRLGLGELVAADIDSLKKAAIGLLTHRPTLANLAENVQTKMAANSVSISEKTVLGIEKALLQLTRLEG